MIWILALVVALGLAGSGLVVAGVYVLSGIGWALVAGGIAVLSGAVLLSRGMTPNG